MLIINIRVIAAISPKDSTGGDMICMPRKPPVKLKHPECHPVSKDNVTAWIIGHPSIFAEGIAASLEMNQYHVRTFAGSFTDREMRILRTAQQPSICIVIADKRRGLIDDCIIWIKRLKTIYPDIYIASIANGSGEGRSRILSAGADAFLSGDFSPEELGVLLRVLYLGRRDIIILTASPADLISDLAHGGYSPQLAAVRLLKNEYADSTIMNLQAYHEKVGLSRREGEILSGLANGDSNKALARKFLISEATVKAHIRAVFKKLGVNSRTQAVKCCMERCPPGVSLYDWLENHHSRKSGSLPREI